MSLIRETNDSALRRKIRGFLNNHHKMVLTILDRDGHPNSSLMLYATDDDLNFYFGTRKSFGKYAALKRDPHVSVAVVEEELDPLRVVDIQGAAEEVPEEKMRETLDWFVSKKPSKYYVKDAEDFVMFKIKPKGIRWLDATSGDLEMHDLKV